MQVINYCKVLVLNIIFLETFLLPFLHHSYIFFFFLPHLFFPIILHLSLIFIFAIFIYFLSLSFSNTHTHTHTHTNTQTHTVPVADVFSHILSFFQPQCSLSLFISLSSRPVSIDSITTSLLTTSLCSSVPYICLNLLRCIGSV